MVTFDLVMLFGLIVLAAAIYSAVGHAGASGYLAAMALMGVPPAIMKPTALTLNIIVATLGTYRLHRAGLVNLSALTPLLVGSIPMAFVGGAIQLPGHWYRLIVGLILLVAAVKLFFDKTSGNKPGAVADRKIPFFAGMLIGMAIGLLSGLTGTGGGIFLSPVLVLFGWANARQASGITAPFILVNSIAGLAGNLAILKSLPPELPYLVVAALCGAFLGTHLGIKRFSIATLQRVLAVVLVVAAAKFITT